MPVKTNILLYLSKYFLYTQAHTHAYIKVYRPTFYNIYTYMMICKRFRRSETPLGCSDTVCTPPHLPGLKKKCYLYVYFLSNLHHVRAGLSLTELALHLSVCLTNPDETDKNNTRQSGACPTVRPSNTAPPRKDALGQAWLL